MKYLSHSLEETNQISLDFLAKISQIKNEQALVVALFGDLGSGKTTFTKGFAEFVGIKKTITSPTFVISKEYPVASSSIKKLVHVDCYRLSSEEDAENTGLTDYLNGGDAILILEWPENIESILPKNVKKIYFEYIDEKTRKITIGNL